MKNIAGGRAVAGGALAPRSRRGNTNQVNAYWAGGSTGSGIFATGGIGAPVLVNVGGTEYYYLQFNATGSLTVVSGGQFEALIFGGGGGGGSGNGYNAIGLGGAKAGTGTLTTTLAAGTYTVTIGAGGVPSEPLYFYTRASGTASSFQGTNGAGGASNANPGGANAAGQAGTNVNYFIGGSNLFKAAGGGNSNTGAGGSGVGGNASGGMGPAQGAAANTASGGGGVAGGGQPNLYAGYGGAGGSGIVYIRWIA